MTFTQELLADPRVINYYDAYLKHPFITSLLDGTLSRDKYKRYLIQDTHYLKDYSKVFAYVYLHLNKVRDLQFLHSCIGVVMSEETNMHIQYLSDFGLDVYQVETLEEEKATRDYLNFMLQYKEDPIKLFCAALPCTLTYEYIGKSLQEKRKALGGDNYYDAWINAYASKEFEDFAIESNQLMDRLTENLSENDKRNLINIFISSCAYEMKFWDMSYGGNYGSN